MQTASTTLVATPPPLDVHAGYDQRFSRVFASLNFFLLLRQLSLMLPRRTHRERFLPRITNPLLQLSRSDNADAQVQRYEQVSFEHPDDDIMVHRDEFLFLNDRGEEMLVGVFSQR